MLVVALTYPTLLTLVYFVWMPHVSEAAQQWAYFVGKPLQFALPLIWVVLVRRQKLRWPAFNSSGLALGGGFGLLISAAIFSLYFGDFKQAGTFNAAGKQMLEHLSGIGVTSPAIYAAVAVFYSLLHSLLEEYYFRWFVFGWLRERLKPHLITAIGFSSIAFMGHHVVVLGLYFGWANPWTYFFSLSTAVGGAYWAWLYNRSGSIYGPWLSHLMLDAAIFGVGYDLVRSVAS
ncbi:MAG TPA: CPBP family intramembrane glutamic endopeptidase [Pirellulales bacterium]|jgi:hypothetical protein